MPGNDEILGFVAYALPVAGGLAGVAYVNLHPEAFINPVLAVAAGAVAGWLLARVLRAVLGRR
ncbi:hypothetical protein [Ruegeria marina]|uniref:Positive regulator of sigma(E), RseC/MucC n=1 Tax=Ruegeria marina TaxID=639004 RepID=A0A1G6Q5X5_9RHOB|nr:hypothetical protein [Ruegeria marina]SDC87015.1 hypothetical protein SAMN04488239_10410 [Ruegeria marina]